MTREEQVSKAMEGIFNDVNRECNNDDKMFDIVEYSKRIAQWFDEHPKSPWISVKDRLPEKHRQIKIKHGDADLDWISAEVIFIDDDGDCFVGMYDFGTEQWVINQDVFLYYHDVYDGGIITHWMPIPEVPKGGEE